MKEQILEIDFSEQIQAQKFGGIKRSDLKDSDFLYPGRKFPIKSENDVRNAISDFGRSSISDSYETFIHKLWNKAKGLGFQNGVPESTQKQYNLK